MAGGAGTPRKPSGGVLAPAARAARLRYLEFEPQDRQLLGELGAVLAPALPGLIADWYRFLSAQPQTRDLLARGNSRERLRAIHTRYFRELLNGSYDRRYFAERLRIGLVHEKVGLEPPWYTGAYRKYQSLVRTHLLASGAEPSRVVAWMEALEKVVYLDMQLALDAYFETFHAGVLGANAALRRMAEELEARNRDLARQFERAQEAARLKEEFLSRISHELHTPLNSILGYSDLLLDGIDGPLEEEQRRSLAKIRRQGERLLAMIDRMIETAKMAAVGVYDPVAFEAATVLERVAAGGREAAHAKGLSFELALDEGLPAVIGDEQGLELALAQLVENAVKFTAAGGVRVEARRAGEAVRIVVADTGPGIPREHAEKIFEAFHQVDSGDRRAVSGLGMGLTLARQAVEKMGGELALLGSGPEGSTFALVLPAAAAAAHLEPTTS